MGTDAARHPATAYASTQFLTAAAPNDVDRLLTPLAACDTGAYQECKVATDRLRAHFDRQSNELAAATTAEALATARVALTSYAGWQEAAMTRDYARSFEARDLAMADVFLQLRELHFPREKAMIWAHNIHVVKAHETVRQSWVGAPIVTLGSAVAQQLGDRYRAVALIGYDVWLNRPEQRGRVVPSPSARSVEATLHQLGQAALFIDLSQASAAEPSVVPSGVAFELGAPGVETHVPSQNYDGLLYLDHSPMAERL
jgi:erythromycin esterase-like protein